MSRLEALRERTRWADSAVRELVDAAPALSEGQRYVLAGLLRVVSS